MGTITGKLPPVAADLPVRDVIKAVRKKHPVDICLTEIGNYLGVKYLHPVNSGRAGLYAILKAMLPDNSKVILPGYTCYTVAAAVARAGMVPVLSDSDPSDLGYDLNELKITLDLHPDAKAIVVCHMFGIPLDIGKIRQIANSEILIIDDAAQGFGIKDNGKFLGTGGDVGFYSFGRGKNLSLVGGGLIATNEEHIAEKIGKVISDQFAKVDGSVLRSLKAASYNLVTEPMVFNLLSRLPGMHLGRSIYDPRFAIGTEISFGVRLLHLLYRQVEIQNEKRMAVSLRYAALLDKSDLAVVPKSYPDGIPGSLRFPVLVNDTGARDKILKKAAGHGWGLSGMYPTALNGIEKLPGAAGYNLKGAEHIARSLVTLPTHRHVQAADAKYGLIQKIAELFV